jgi:hypothetical protein
MSLRLKSRTVLPPKGILFEEKSTGFQSWIADPTSRWDFRRCCRLVQQHRQSNPGISARLGLSTDLGVIEDEVDKANALRVSAIPNADIYLMEGNSPPPKSLAPPSLNRLAAVAGAVKKIQAGAELLLEWEESGEAPVDSVTATNRARICVGCPKNGKSALTEWFTVPASELIRKRISRLNDLNLSTPYDPGINVCVACLCPLRLKVHVSLHLALKHLTPEARAQLDPSCWMLHETESFSTDTARG